MVALFCLLLLLVGLGDGEKSLPVRPATTAAAHSRRSSMLMARSASPSCPYGEFLCPLFDLSSLLQFSHRLPSTSYHIRLRLFAEPFAAFHPPLPIVWCVVHVAVHAQDPSMDAIVLRRASCSWCCLGSSLLNDDVRCLPNLLIVPNSCGGAPGQGSCPAVALVDCGCSCVAPWGLVRTPVRCVRLLAKSWYCDPSMAPHIYLCLSW